MSGRIRVMRVIARMNIGGPALQVRGLMTQLDPDRFEQVLVTGAVGRDEQDALGDAPTPFRVARIDRLGRRVAPLDDLSAARDLDRVIRAYRPHVMHTHTAKAGVLGRLLGTVGGVPIRVHTFHGHLLSGYFSPAGTAAVTLSERLLAHTSHHLLAVGDRVRADLLAAGVGRADRFTTMPPGIPVPATVAQAAARARLGVPLDVPCVAVVGRFAAIKRPDRAAEVLRRTAALHPGLVVLAAGDGTELAEFRARTRGVDVRFLGWYDDIATVHAASDVSLLTSDNEGMPISLIEAGMLARPAVATDVGSVREVVRDGVTGVLCPPRVDALTGALDELLRDPARRSRMGAAAAAWTRDRFSVERLATDHERLYDSLLQRRPLPAPA